MPDEPDQSGELPPNRKAPPSRTVPGDDGKLVAGWIGMIGIGFEFLAAIVLMGALGWYLDRRLGTSPWLLIAGGAVGFAAGLTLMLRAAAQSFKD